MEAKQNLLASSKRDLEEEKELLQRGKREAAAEADKLDQRREVRRAWGREKEEARNVAMSDIESCMSFSTSLWLGFCRMDGGGITERGHERTYEAEARKGHHSWTRIGNE